MAILKKKKKKAPGLDKPHPQALSSKMGGEGGENLVTSAGKVVDIQCLALVVPI